MNNQKAVHRGRNLLVILTALVIILYGINQAQSVVALLVSSVFLALIGTPPVLWLERKRVPPFAAVMVVMAGMIASLLILGFVAGSSLSSFSDVLPSYQERLQEQILALKPVLASKDIVVPDDVLLEYFNPAPLLGLVAGVLAGLSSALSSIVLMMLTATFILLEAPSFPRKLRAVLGKSQATFPQVTTFVHTLERYVIIKTLTSLATGILIGLWLLLLGVEFPILWGFLAFLLNFIPNVGSAAAAIPPVLLALIQFGIGTAVMVATGYLVVNFVLDDVIETRIMGQKLGLSTLVVFLSLIVWEGLLGPVGLVLCVPLTMALKFAFENNEGTHWMVVLLGQGKVHRELTIV